LAVQATAALQVIGSPVEAIFNLDNYNFIRRLIAKVRADIRRIKIRNKGRMSGLSSEFLAGWTGVTNFFDLEMIARCC